MVNCGWRNEVVAKHGHRQSTARILQILPQTERDETVDIEVSTSRDNPPVKRYCKNPSGRDFVVGDLHGMVTQLEQLLQDVSFSNNDRLFITGDLIDRGDRNADALALLKAHNIFSILGNHDAVMLDVISTYPMDEHSLLNWSYMGGDWYIDNMDNYDHLLGEWIELLSALPYAIEIETEQGLVGLVHANCPNSWSDFVEGLDSSPSYRQMAIWDRSRFNIIHSEAEPFIDGIDQVFIGHSIVDRPIQKGNIRYIDTGAFRANGTLTMIEV